MTTFAMLSRPPHPTPPSLKMTDAPCTNSLRRGIKTAALYVVGIPFIVFGMLLVLTIVAVDKIERRGGEPQP